jgi:hypothetical protein
MESGMFPHLTSNEIDLAKSVIGLLTVVAPFFLKKRISGCTAFTKKIVL